MGCGNACACRLKPPCGAADVADVTRYINVRDWVTAELAVRWRRTWWPLYQALMHQVP